MIPLLKLYHTCRQNVRQPDGQGEQDARKLPMQHGPLPCPTDEDGTERAQALADEGEVQEAEDVRSHEASQGQGDVDNHRQCQKHAPLEHPHHRARAALHKHQVPRGAPPTLSWRWLQIPRLHPNSMCRLTIRERYRAPLHERRCNTGSRPAGQKNQCKSPAEQRTGPVCRRARLKRRFAPTAFAPPTSGSDHDSGALLSPEDRSTVLFNGGKYNHRRNALAPWLDSLHEVYA
jgi:hypothetical protein